MTAFETPLEQNAAMLVLNVEVHRVSGCKLAHKSCDTLVHYLFQHQMKMVRHERVSEYINQFLSSRAFIIWIKDFHQGRSFLELQGSFPVDNQRITKDGPWYYFLKSS